MWLPTPDPTTRRRVVSAVNTRVDALFRENGVEIPFPQRDLHLRSSDIGALGPQAANPVPPPDTEPGPGGKGEEPDEPRTRP